MGLKEYNKAILKDREEVNDMEIEVNFSTERKLKKYVKVTLGDKSAVVAIKDLHQFLLIVGDIEQKASLLPYRTMMSKKLIRSHVVEVNQDMKKGDRVTIRCETDVPLTIYEKLEQEALEKLRLNN